MARLEGLRGHAASAMIRLLKEGFDKRSAKALAERYPLERIQRQCELMKQRAVTKSRLGMLRKAIEEDWEAPAQGSSRGKKASVVSSERKLADPKRTLERLERELQDRWPERFVAFEQEELKQRTAIEQMQLVSEDFKKTLLNAFDSPKKRLERLRAFQK